MSEEEYAKSILEQEIDGLEQLKASLDKTLIDAIDLLYRKEGHIIVSGMGKPGHVGRKIAATLSSTGSPAFFLHPAEASHGDLGEISPNDVLLVLSLSGNTQELVPLLMYAKRFDIDLVGVTANPDSILAKSSKVTILLPKVMEACPYNLAPTTTTTMMMALGDILALCLLKRKEFKRDDFKNLHPGGALGKRLLKVNDLMHSDLPLVHENDIMKDVLVEMTKKSFGCVGIVNSANRLIGIITDGDLRRNMSNDLLSKSAKEIMSMNPKIISDDTFAQEAVRLMNTLKITSLFVLKNNQPVGIIHIHDCLRAGLA